MTCADAKKAEIEGRYKRETTEAMLVGNYVDNALTSPQKFEAWCSEHSGDIFGKSKKYKAFETADALIARVQNDPLYKAITEKAQAQVTLEGEIAGERWIYIADWIIEGDGWAQVLDLKTARNFDDDWGTQEEPDYEGQSMQRRNRKLPWYDAMGYWRQLAIGRELYRQMKGITPVCGIVAATKQDPIALGTWVMEYEMRFEREIGNICRRMPEVKGWKDGTIPTWKCGTCEWCRSQTTLEPEHVAVSGRSWTVD